MMDHPGAAVGSGADPNMVGGGRAQDWRVEAPKFLGARSGTVTHGICTAPNVVTTRVRQVSAGWLSCTSQDTWTNVFPVFQVK